MEREISGRRVTELKTDWRFIRGEQPGAERPDYDDSGWKTVRVPHDWAIEGPFDPNNDMQYLAIIQDGMKKPMDHTGRTGGLPTTGTGWYRREFDLPESDRGKAVRVEFDGAMSNAEVYLNGVKVGAWAYGYSSFAFDLTEQAVFGGRNVLAVRLEPQPLFSRWYPGAGIYRNVRLLVLEPVHVAHWGTYVTTPEISADKGTVKIATTVYNVSSACRVGLKTLVLDPDGREKASAAMQMDVDCNAVFEQSLDVPRPLHWDVDDPQLYTAVSIVSVEGRETDRYETRFGFRNTRFDAAEGFFLNGRPLKFKGVCQHHDLGPLGAAVNRRGVQRQLEMLRDMGCNAIRTSHNPPAPELLELCDEMGFLVIDEAFDEWKFTKMENGYHLLYDEWAEKDLRAMIRRDRNHPSVVIWSIGNEIPEQSQPGGAEVARFLTDICHDADPTRPVTCGFNGMDHAIDNGLAEIVDIAGWNYQSRRYQECHDKHPDWLMVGTETSSASSSRGSYTLPVVERQLPEKDHAKQDVYQISSYDLECMRWGTTADLEFKAQEEAPFMMGEFVWTGFDYIGEPSPFYAEWPSRSSYFGIIDLCGHPKDRFYLYRSHWSDQPTLHLLPHWNWAGREGEIVPVYCYTNYEAAELFLNGKSLGIRRKEANGASVYDRYRLRWNEVRYEPGTLKVVALGDNGKPAMTAEMKTAGCPARLELRADRVRLAADGDDLSFVTARIVDKDGNLCPRACERVYFDVSGAAELIATGNGDPTSVDTFVQDSYPAFNGLCLAVARSIAGKPGRATVRAQVPGLVGAETVLEVGGK